MKLYWSCLCCILLWVSLVAFISVLIWYFTYWLDYHSHGHVQFTVDNASLAWFDLDPSTGTLRHNLTLAVSVGNGDDNSAVYYTKLEAAAYFGGSELGFQSLYRFSQWHKTTTHIYPSFQGQTRLNGRSSHHVLAEFRRERGEGYYAIDVRFHSEIRVEWDVKGWDGGSYTRRKGYSPEVDCWLRVPAAANNNNINGVLSSSSSSTTDRFTATSCDVRL